MGNRGKEFKEADDEFGVNDDFDNDFLDNLALGFNNSNCDKDY